MSRREGRFGAVRKSWISGEKSCVTDYRSYSLSLKEWIRYGAAGLLLAAAVAALFYRSLLAFFLLTPLAALIPLRMRGKLKEKRLDELAGQFRDGAQALVAALAAGFAIENAFTEAAGEMEELYGENGLITEEFRGICRLISLNLPAEEAVSQFASRSGLAEIEQFAEVFGIARRSSGDLASVLRETVSILTRKIDLAEEIRTLAAGRKLEQRIMTVMPPAILVYVNLASPGFTDPLYEGMAGRLLMTGCLGVYILAVWLGERILAVEI